MAVTELLLTEKHELGLGDNSETKVLAQSPYTKYDDRSLHFHQPCNRQAGARCLARQGSRSLQAPRQTLP